MATRAWQPPDRPSLAQLTLHEATADLLDVEPLDLGPAAPATTALELERGSQPKPPAPRGE